MKPQINKGMNTLAHLLNPCLILIGLGMLFPIVSIERGVMQFSLNNTVFTARGAEGAIIDVNGKKRIFIAVKDRTAGVLLMITADVASGNELLPLNLTTVETELSVSLRSRSGVLTVLPQMQLSKDINMRYNERIEVASNEDEVVEEVGNDGKKHSVVRKKVKTEYRRVKPVWHSMSRDERRDTGQGVYENQAFKDTFFSVQLVPEVANGKVVAYTGTFTGTGRFSNGINTSMIKTLQQGSFNVRIQYAE